MKNNLFINRLLIYTNEGNIAYDEPFHKGVNIIRGVNSSGKSTITHFIFFVLGGSFTEFVPEAKKCSVVYAEVEMNGALFTIKRDIILDEKSLVNSKAALYFYWGTLDESLNPPPENYWQKFEYNTTNDKKSFSNVIFDNLNIPLVKGDNNISFHQLLRLLYIDQESPTNSLFLYEQFDSQITRETVADLLLGVYNEELYENKKRLIVATKEFDNVKSELKATQQFFSDPLTLNPEHLKTIIENKQKEIFQIEEEIIAIRNQKKEILYDENAKLAFQTLSELAIRQRQIVVNLEEEINTLKHEIEDSGYFIETLQTKIKALKNSIQTRDFLGTFPLDYCPECLTKIKVSENDTTCKLCKENIDESYGVVQARRMEQEISFQINESTKLLGINSRVLLELLPKRDSEIIKLKQIQTQVNTSLKDVKSYNEEGLDKLYTNKGFVEGEVIQYRNMLENAELFSRLEELKNKLEKEINYLRGYIHNTEKKQGILKEEINEKIKKEGLYLLKNDLDRQVEFMNANEFFIDYSNNMAFISNIYSKYSASSNFYLKVTARFAIFLASLTVKQMRFPRFIFADNMEDKGIELERARNFQKILIDRVTKFESSSYQMIYTTSYISEELNNSSYCVGEYYTLENPTLKNIKI